jgi:phosphoglycolate phosphatase
MTSRRKTPRNIKLAIFDLDGTLADAFPAIADSINYMLKEMGFPPVSLRKVKRSVGWGVDSLVNGFVTPDKAVEALLLFRKHHDVRLRDNIKLLPGVKTLLPFLKAKGCVLAIASNRPAQFCHLILKGLDIDHYFDHVICGDSVKHPKPSPDMVQAILRASRVAAVEAIFTGELMAAKPDMFIERISQVRELFR